MMQLDNSAVVMAFGVAGLAALVLAIGALVIYSTTGSRTAFFYGIGTMAVVLITPIVLFLSL